MRAMMVRSNSGLKAVMMLAVLGLCFTLSGVRNAEALIEIDITRGQVEPMPIAISDFLGGSERDRQYAQSISSASSTTT